MNPQHLRELITEVLTRHGMYSEEAVELLMLTAAQETHCGRWLKQINGPALGIFQIEPRTYQDLWDNYLVYHDDKAEHLRIYGAHRQDCVKQHLKGNLLFQIIVARLYYSRFAEPLPPYHDANRMAHYYKMYWNTDAGKATVEEAEANYRIYAGWG